jgi:hypothetical protein
MTASEAELDGLVVSTAQLAAMLDVSATHVQDLVRRGVLEQLRKPNGAAVRGRFQLVATVRRSAVIFARRRLRRMIALWSQKLRCRQPA